jgi:hypothetical protein
VQVSPSVHDQTEYGYGIEDENMMDESQDVGQSEYSGNEPNYIAFTNKMNR